jgi:serine protease Do
VHAKGIHSHLVTRMPTPKAGASAALSDLSSSFAAAVARASESVVAIHARRRIPSSGILWRDDVVVSASHTVKRDDGVPVVLPNGERMNATVAGRDAGADLVALRLETKAGPAPRASGGALRVGSLVLAVGRPGQSATASFGIISAIREDWRAWDGTRVGRVARLDLNVYDGFSGGALVDASGALVGLNNSALARGAPLALSVEAVDRVLDELLERGHVRRPFLGISAQPVILTPVDGGDQPALLITSVAADSAAQRAGLLVGDVLRAAAGRKLGHPADLLDALAESRAGEPVQLDVLRGGAPTSVTVIPADRSTGA